MVVSLGRFRKKREKEEREWRELDRKMEAFEKAVAFYEESNTVESMIGVLASMYELDSAMANTPFGRQAAVEKKKRDENFRNRYRDVFASAPDMPVARIKYFCGVLLKLWPSVEEDDWEARHLACNDIFDVYSEGVDRALSDWCRRDRKTDEMEDEVQAEYPFLQLEVTKENMGTLFTETLERIISACPEEGVAAKKSFLWELARLFEVCRGILYVFSDEVEAWQEAGDYEPDGCGIGDGKPD